MQLCDNNRHPHHWCWEQQQQRWTDYHPLPNLSQQHATHAADKGLAGTTATTQSRTAATSSIAHSHASHTDHVQPRAMTWCTAKCSARGAHTKQPHNQAASPYTPRIWFMITCGPVYLHTCECRRWENLQQDQSMKHRTHRTPQHAARKQAHDKPHNRATQTATHNSPYIPTQSDTLAHGAAHCHNQGTKKHNQAQPAQAQCSSQPTMKPLDRTSGTHT